MVVAVPQLLVVGLGNLPLPLTRHSVGHLIVDSLASRLGVRMTSDRAMGGLYGQTDVTIGESSVSLTLYKPKPLMNITGPAVVGALRKTAKSPASMVVIHDSLDHTPQTISPKFGGSANGHNGVKSIISALGGDSGFHRFRVGIGRDARGNAADYVLSKLPGSERRFWSEDGDGLDVVWRELERVVRKMSS